MNENNASIEQIKSLLESTSRNLEKIEKLINKLHIKTVKDELKEMEGVIAPKYVKLQLNSSHKKTLK